MTHYHKYRLTGLFRNAPVTLNVASQPAFSYREIHRSENIKQAHTRFGFKVLGMFVPYLFIHDYGTTELHMQTDMLLNY